MPKRTDIQSILIIGSGPIVIGQACEFDYSGTQACKALKEEGYRVILVNSNPASIMTDPEFADKTYIEPITVDVLRHIIIAERPDALLPTMGGQTALNMAMALAEQGILKQYNVQLIGANIEAIKKAEDRELFKQAMLKIGLNVPQSGVATRVDEAVALTEKTGFPVILRPAFTMGGTGGGIAYNMEELKIQVQKGLDASPIGQVLVEQSLIGWKEFELEVMRDTKDNVVIICSIENIDAMGVHTGDSITVAPAQTLSDKEYQRLRDYSLLIIREIGVDTGGSNIQFAVSPITGDVMIIEMNPRVSRSSALASKATGFPIAKIAAKLAIGYTLDEIPNDITRLTPASFEPTIDYVVTKVPRFTFEKFTYADPTLTTMMKSVGEAMSIGRTFKESFQKALRSMEIGKFGFIPMPIVNQQQLETKLRVPTAERIYYVRSALDIGMSIDSIYQLSGIDPWFLHQFNEIVELETKVKAQLGNISLLKQAKQNGFSDRQIGALWNMDERDIADLRKKNGIIPVYKTVDTCGAEFEAQTPYYYSTYDQEDEVTPSLRKKVMILGGGPNRIGQGIEFDYCCVHASFALKEIGIESIMVNSNPETVSTDYDTSDRLYFEPLTLEDVLSIIDREKPDGVIVQFGGQTPLKLALPLLKAGAPIIGTSPDSIDLAEDRERFGNLIRELKLLQPENGMAKSFDEAKTVADEIGYPVVVRPSYVLGGRAMEIVYDEVELKRYMDQAVVVSPDHPILIDKFLEDAIELDVDAVCDGVDCLIAGIMEHVEEAGIHSGDSACVLPTFSIDNAIKVTIRKATVQLAKALKVIGLMNIQFAVKNKTVYVLEVNPRASRTIPFVSKATGVAWAKVATKIMLGKTLAELGVKEVIPHYVSVKEAVLPFSRFIGQDILLGPEMRSTGEVMGIDYDMGHAFYKAECAAGERMPLQGTVFISVNDKDKKQIMPIAKRLSLLGFTLVATKGTATAIRNSGVTVADVLKVHEGRPNVSDMIKSKKIDLVINTPIGKGARLDDRVIREAAVMHKVLCITTLAAATAFANSIAAVREKGISVKALQDYYRELDEKPV